MKILRFFVAIFLLYSASAIAADRDYDLGQKNQTSLEPPLSETLKAGFFFQPFLSLEYSAPGIKGGGANANFRTNAFEVQLANFQNIAPGLHVRVHKFLGFNANWYQSELVNGSLQGVSLSQRPKYKIDQYNFSALVFLPKVEFIEFFGEFGVAMMRNRISYVDSSGMFISQVQNKNTAFYGGGFQLTPFKNSKDAIRFSIQKYSGTMPLLGDSHYTTVRIGYLFWF
jgi:hypothetical protein